MASTWTNADGLRVRFGGGVEKAGKVGRAGISGVEDAAVVEFTNVSAADGSIGVGSDNQQVPIPKGSVIHDVHLEVVEGFAGAGFIGLNIGTVKADGSALDTDGFFAATGKGAALNLASPGTVTGETTEIGTVISNTDDAYIVVSVAGSAPTSGKARLVVQYS